MLRRLILIFSLAAVPAFAETAKGEIDWTRRVLIGHGQGAPDLNAPSIAVARLGAERAAKLDAYRNALETLKGMQLQSGGSVGTLLQNDATLTSRVDGELKGVKPIKTHYYSDGGVSLDIEVPLDELPPDLAKAIKVPGGVAPLTGAGGGAPATCWCRRRKARRRCWAATSRRRERRRSRTPCATRSRWRWAPR